MHRLVSPAFCCLPIVVVCVSLLWLPSTASASVPDDGVWITLGADAFATLRAEPGLRFEAQDLRALDERADVVLTRVHVRDLERISAVLHAAHHRCSGFLTHRHLAAAERALEQAARAPVVGAPIDYLIDQPTLVTALQSELDADTILGTIEHLSTTFNNRFFNHPSGKNAALWIRDQWQVYAASRPDVTVETFTHPDWQQPSVILTIPGSSLADEVVVLGGHLDSIAAGSSNPNFLAPGADDNASGIAVLTEVIRVALAADFHPQRTVMFMGYAAEEVGLEGSQAIAAKFAADGTNVVAVLQLDMTAFNGSVEDVGLLTDFTNSQLTGFLGDLLDTYLPDLLWTFTACGYGCSDHASWHLEGFPAAMSFEARVGQHNNRIHTTNDNLAQIGNSGAHAHKFARLATAFVVEVGIDGAESGIVFADGFEAGDTSAWSATVVP